MEKLKKKNSESARCLTTTWLLNKNVMAVWSSIHISKYPSVLSTPFSPKPPFGSYGCVVSIHIFSRLPQLTHSPCYPKMLIFFFFFTGEVGWPSILPLVSPRIKQHDIFSSHYIICGHCPMPFLFHILPLMVDKLIYISILICLTYLISRFHILLQLQLY